MAAEIQESGSVLMATSDLMDENKLKIVQLDRIDARVEKLTELIDAFGEGKEMVLPRDTEE